jgi:hypothetical protein
VREIVCFWTFVFSKTTILARSGHEQCAIK